MPNIAMFEKLTDALSNRSATVGVIGLGYVGLPLAVAASRGGFSAIGFDIDEKKTATLNSGTSYIAATSSAKLQELIQARRFYATTNFLELNKCDVIVICVPTPLTQYREPDLSYIDATARAIAKTLRPGQLIVLESTSYPGTTREVVKPILEKTGLICGKDFFLGFSPEREDPGNKSFDTVSIPKVIGGDGEQTLALLSAFYSAVVKKVVPVSSAETAEAVKITENIFRAVNIALVNELKTIYAAMDIDIWEVIEAAKTKPFGYMPFYPGPGLGGHCIPIDPFYLTWKSREYDLPTRFIELAGEINVSMPRHVVDVLTQALDKHQGIALSTAHILIIGLAYKKNIPDIRESPTFKLMEILEHRGAKIDYHDPHIAEIPQTREHTNYRGRRSVAINAETLSKFDVVLISTDHDAVDYGQIFTHSKLIIDTRNVMARNNLRGDHVVKA
jgi:UDP-N-acetyl-D-glucosamine dehydrogenase